MAVTYKELFHLLTDRGMTNAELVEKAGFTANIITRIKRDNYISLDSIEKICKTLVRFHSELSVLRFFGTSKLIFRSTGVPMPSTLPSQLYCQISKSYVNVGAGLYSASQN